MWEKEMRLGATESVGRGGTTLTCSSEKFGFKATVELAFASNTLQATVKVGDYEYSSDWLAVSPLLGPTDMVATTAVALKRWQEHATTLSSRQASGFTPMELTAHLFTVLEPYLA